MKSIQSVVEAAAALILGAVAVVVFLQVITRYALQTAIPWSEETARYLLVWLTFLGAAAAGARGQQLVVDTLTELVPRRFQPAVKLFSATAGLVAIGVLVYASLPLFGAPARTTSPATGIEARWIYYALPTGCAFLILFLLRDIIDALARRPRAENGDRVDG